MTRAQVAIRVAGALATIVALVGAGMVLGAFVGGEAR